MDDRAIAKAVKEKLGSYDVEVGEIVDEGIQDVNRALAVLNVRDSKGHAGLPYVAILDTAKGRLVKAVPIT